MNSKTIVMIAAMGAIGAFAFVLAAMLGLGKIAKRPMVAACVAVAKEYKVQEVTLAAVPRDEKSRTLKFSYETDVDLATSEERTAEMEKMAKFAFDQALQAELKEISDAKVDEFTNPKLADKRKALEARTPIRLVTIHRTWRRDRGCVKRSEEADHEWTPPPQPARK